MNFAALRAPRPSLLGAFVAVLLTLAVMTAVAHAEEPHAMTAPADMEIQIADKVVELLNSEPLSIACTAERLYEAKYALSEEDGLLVPVVISGLDSSAETRVRDRNDFAIDVGIMKKVPDKLPATIDPLTRLRGEIIARVAGAARTGLGTDPDGHWFRTDYKVIWDQQLLHTKHVYQSIVTFNFRVIA